MLARRIVASRVSQFAVAVLFGFVNATVLSAFFVDRGIFDAKRAINKFDLFVSRCVERRLVKFLCRAGDASLAERGFSRIPEIPRREKPLAPSVFSAFFRFRSAQTNRDERPDSQSGRNHRNERSCHRRVSRTKFRAVRSSSSTPTRLECVSSRVIAITPIPPTHSNSDPPRTRKVPTARQFRVPRDHRLPRSGSSARRALSGRAFISALAIADRLASAARPCSQHIVRSRSPEHPRRDHTPGELYSFFAKCKEARS